MYFSCNYLKKKKIKSFRRIKPRITVGPLIGTKRRARPIAAAPHTGGRSGGRAAGAGVNHALGPRTKSPRRNQVLLRRKEMSRRHRRRRRRFQ